MPAKSDQQSTTPLTDDRKKALNLAIAQIEKQIGKGSIMRMGQDAPRVKVGAISTGAINLDAAIGVGGIPRGRITEIYGPESSGKTTLALHIAANAQKVGGVAAFIDAEHALDVEYARKLGVDIEDLLVSQPDTGEEALEIAEILVRSGAVDVIVVDSVAALVPKAEIEGDMGDSHMGLQARLMSQALRKLAGSINRSRTSVVFINQLREKIGVMFGNPETTTGGRALKFYSSVRLDVRRIGPVKERDEITGSKVRVKVVKNKVAPPFRQAEFDIMFSEGISHTSLLVDIGAEAGIIDRSGAWYSYGKERIGQGRENAKLYLKDHDDIAAEIEQKVRAVLGIEEEKPEEESQETTTDGSRSTTSGCSASPTSPTSRAPTGWPCACSPPAPERCTRCYAASGSAATTPRPPPRLSGGSRPRGCSTTRSSPGTSRACALPGATVPHGCSPICWPGAWSDASPSGRSTRYWTPRGWTPTPRPGRWPRSGRGSSASCRQR
jgi:recombination protein RecA